MAWTKIDNPTTTWTKLSTGGWFRTPWFYGWFTIWKKLTNPTTAWTEV